MNTAAPIIVILGCLEVDIEVLDVGMETIGSDDCREMSEDNKDANGILAIT